MKTSQPRLLVLSLLMLGGCGGGEQLILPGDGQPVAIEVVDGDGQSGVVGEPLADLVVVRVTDSRGRPVEGVSVAFEFGGAGAGADVIPETAETNSDGKADAQLVLGTAIGRQTGRARVVTGEGQQPITTAFSATALPENANRLQAVAGQDQTGHVGQALDDRLVVEVTDGFGNPVPNVQIDWSAEGGGSVSEATVLTGDDGRARVERILGPAVGPQTTVARSEGLAGSPVVFDHTAIAGNASRLVIESGNEQTAAAGSAVPNELVVRLVDADGNGVSGTGLSWVVATGGGSASPENTATDGNGRATTRWTLGETLGDQRIDAVVSGVGFISFKATATAGAPAALSISTQPSSSAANGVPLERQPVIQLRDSRGNPTGAAGVQVRVSLGSGGGELLGTLTRSTDGSGRAVFTDLAITGDAGARTLFFSAEGYAGVTSNPINVGAPANRPPTAAFTVSCQNLSCSFNDGSSDSDGNIEGHSWSFGDGSNTNESNPSHTYAAAGTYQVALTVTDDDGATSSAARAITVSGPPAPGNRAPNANFNWFCPSLRCDFTDSSHDPDGDGTIASRVWNWGDGTTTANELNPSHTYAAPGDYHVTLTVTDNGGLSDVSDDDVDPKAQSLRIRREPSGSADQGVPFQRQPEIELRAGGGDLNQAGVVITAGIASGAGSLGGTVTATTDGQGRAAFTDLSISGAAGPHTLRFTASGFGEVVSNTIDVGGAGSTTTITSDDPDPSIAGSLITVNVSVTSGTGTTPTGNVTVSVTGANPPPPCTVPLSGGNATCQFTLNAVGDRVFTASYGGDGLHSGSQDQEPHRVDPQPTPNQSPTAAFSAPSCTTLQACQFNGSDSGDSDGTITTYTWNFGDGTTESGPEAARTHTYATASVGEEYQVTLTVTDDDGATGSVTHQVMVTDPAPPAIRVLNLREQPPSAVANGASLDPSPEIELRFDPGDEIKEEGVTVSVSLLGGGVDGLGGSLSHETDNNGRAKFDDLTITGTPGSSVTLHFEAPGYTAADSQPIIIN